MTLIVVNQGEQAILANGVTGVAYDLRLFTNEVTSGLTPAQIQALTEADFDEATFTGYSAAAIGIGDWTITQGDPTVALNLEKSFVSSADQTAEDIWGYDVTRNSDGALIWFEQFAGPIVVEFTDDEIRVTPRLTLDDKGGDEVPIGGSILWSGDTSTIPPNYLLRDGSAVSRSTYALLFAVIGETYGAGDGSTTFNLPDQQGRFPLGVAAAGTGSVRGETGGVIDHVHGLDTASSHAKLNVSTSNVPYQRQKTGMPEWTATRQGDGSGSNSTTTTTSATELGGDSDTANPPYLAEYFIIKAL